MTTVESVPGRSRELDKTTVLILPNGKAQATVVVPEEMRDRLLIPRARSRRARIGLHVMVLQKYMPDQSGTLEIALFNWSPSYALIIREGDAITLTPLKWVETLPLVEKIPFTADGVYLQMKEDALPRINGIPFFDPVTMDPKEYMEVRMYDAIQLKKCGHLVLRMQERLAVPDHHVGFVSSAVQGLIQNSAQVIYPGSNGNLVMEMKAFRPLRIEPGMHLANMTLHNASWLPPYEGSLGKKQGSIIPPFW